MQHLLHCWEYCIMSNECIMVCHRQLDIHSALLIPFALCTKSHSCWEDQNYGRNSKQTDGRRTVKPKQSVIKTAWWAGLAHDKSVSRTAQGIIMLIMFIIRLDDEVDDLKQTWCCRETSMTCGAGQHNTWQVHEVHALSPRVQPQTPGTQCDLKYKG